MSHFSFGLRRSCALVACVLMLTACAVQPTKSIKDQTLPRGSSSDISASAIPKIRSTALRQTALTFGAQSSLAWTSKGINASLKKEERKLDEIFNFNRLLLNNDVLPPVLSEGEDTLASDDPTSLRLADKEYKIESPPKFVTAAPTWRDYLWMSYAMPDKPNVTLLPENQKEEKLWHAYYEEGWKEGVVQANEIFAENMGRLKRDYSGMILYRKLLAQKIVTPPFVAKDNLGVTGDANQIRINDQVLRITSTSQLVTDTRRWKAVVVPGIEGATRTQGHMGPTE